MKSFNLLNIDDDDFIEISDEAFKYFNENKSKNSYIITYFWNENHELNNYLIEEDDKLNWYISNNIKKEILEKIINLSLLLSIKIINKNTSINEINFNEYLDEKDIKLIKPEFFSFSLIKDSVLDISLIKNDLDKSVINDIKYNKYKFFNNNFLIGYILELCDLLNEKSKINFKEIFKSNLYSSNTSLVEKKLNINIKELESNFEENILSFKNILNKLFDYQNDCFLEINEVLKPKDNFLEENIERILISFKECILNLYNENKENSLVKYYEVKDNYYDLLNSLKIEEKNYNINVENYFIDLHNTIIKILKLFKQLKGKEKYKKIFEEFPIKIGESISNSLGTYVNKIQKEFYNLNNNYTSLKDVKLNLEVEVLKNEKNNKISDKLELEELKSKLDSKKLKIKNLKEYIKKLEDDNKKSLQEFIKKSQLLQDINKKYYETELEKVNLKRLFSESKDINLMKNLDKNNFNENLDIFKNTINNFKKEFNLTIDKITQNQKIFEEFKQDLNDFVIDLKNKYIDNINNSFIKNKNKDDFINLLNKEIEENKIKIKNLIINWDNLQNNIIDLRLKIVENEKNKMKNENIYENIIKNLNDRVTINKLSNSKLEYVNEEQIVKYKELIEQANIFKYLIKLINIEYWKEKNNEKRMEYIKNFKKNYNLIKDSNKEIINQIIQKNNIKEKFIKD